MSDFVDIFYTNNTVKDYNMNKIPNNCNSFVDCIKEGEEERKLYWIRSSRMLQKYAILQYKDEDGNEKCKLVQLRVWVQNYKNSEVDICNQTVTNDDKKKIISYSNKDKRKFKKLLDSMISDDLSSSAEVKKGKKVKDDDENDNMNADDDDEIRMFDYPEEKSEEKESSETLENEEIDEEPQKKDQKIKTVFDQKEEEETVPEVKEEDDIFRGDYSKCISVDDFKKQFKVIDQVANDEKIEKERLKKSKNSLSKSFSHNIVKKQSRMKNNPMIIRTKMKEKF